MIVFITSCGRPDLLEQTLSSFLLNNHLDKINLIIHEDSKDVALAYESARLSTKLLTSSIESFSFIHTNGLGQHGSIEKFLNDAPDEKYFIALEDDWEFNNRYNWIGISMKIMDVNPYMIKVLARQNSPHPCKYDKAISENGFLEGQSSFGILEPWQNSDSLWWCGFSWNPGVTRLDLLRKFPPLPLWEQDLGLTIHKNGYKVAALEHPIYKHIGGDRSTHAK